MDQIHDIIEQLREKDYKSFDTFYNLTKNQVFYAIINIVKDKDLVHDIMQDTYIKFLEKIDQYKTGSNPYAYISMIGRNLAINTYNKQKRIIRSDELLESIPAEKDVEPNEDIFKILDLLSEDETEKANLEASLAIVVEDYETLRLEFKAELEVIKDAFVEEITNLKDALKLFRFGFRCKNESNIEFNRP